MINKQEKNETSGPIPNKEISNRRDNFKENEFDVFLDIYISL